MRARTGSRSRRVASTRRRTWSVTRNRVRCAPEGPRRTGSAPRSAPIRPAAIRPARSRSRATRKQAASAGGSAFAALRASVTWGANGRGSSAMPALVRTAPRRSCSSAQRGVAVDPQDGDAAPPHLAAGRPQDDRCRPEPRRAPRQRGQARPRQRADEVQRQVQRRVGDRLRARRPAPGVAVSRQPRAQRRLGPERQEQAGGIAIAHRRDRRAGPARRRPAPGNRSFDARLGRSKMPAALDRPPRTSFPAPPTGDRA